MTITRQDGERLALPATLIASWLIREGRAVEATPALYCVTVSVPTIPYCRMRSAIGAG